MRQSAPAIVMVIGLTLGACGTQNSEMPTTSSGVPAEVSSSSSTADATAALSFAEDASAFVTSFLPPLDVLLGIRSNVTAGGCTESEQELRLVQSRLNRRIDDVDTVEAVIGRRGDAEPLSDLVESALAAQSDHCAQVRLLEERRRQAISDIPATASQDAQFQLASDISTATRSLVFDSYSEFRPEASPVRVRLLVIACWIVREFPDMAKPFSDDLADAYLAEYENNERKFRIRLGVSPTETVETVARRALLEDYGDRVGFLTRICQTS